MVRQAYDAIGGEVSRYHRTWKLFHCGVIG
jgi:hypothetical protein